MAASDVSFAYLRSDLDKVTNIADIVLLKEDLNLIYESILLGKRTYSVIKQNITISLIIKAAIILNVVFNYVGIGSMLIVALIDLLVSLLVILNCFRILQSTRILFEKKRAKIK